MTKVLNKDFGSAELNGIQNELEESLRKQKEKEEELEKLKDELENVEVGLFFLLFTILFVP